MSTSQAAIGRSASWRRLTALVWGRDRWTPAAVVALFLADAVLSRLTGIGFTGWDKIVLATVLLAAVAVFYTVVRDRPALAEAVLYAGLWVAFSSAGACLTYFGASLDMPLHDDLFAAADRALGFDWLAWARFLRSSHTVEVALALVYRTLGIQIILSVILLAFRRVPRGNEELLRCAILSLVITTIAFAIGASLGPIPYYHYDGASADTMAYLAELVSLRAHGAATYSILTMQGIIPFPSYHVVLAILLTYAQRHNRWTLGLFLLVNGAMLPSIPTEGSHYVIDMIAGAVIAVATIAAVRATLRRPIGGHDGHSAR